MFRYVVFNRIKIVLITAVAYFCADYFIRITGFLQFTSCVGLKSFMPATFGLLFGIYGIIGQIIGCFVSSLFWPRATNLLQYEFVIILIIGIGLWFTWHINSLTHKVHFRYLGNYFKFFTLLMLFTSLVGMLSQSFTRAYLFSEVVAWNTSLSMLFGIPIMIIYSGLMSLNPILPPLVEDGEMIHIVDDIREALTKDPQSFASFSEKLELLSEREKVDMKRSFEMQGLVEEIYLRIIDLYPEAVIDVKANYDITFSVEFIYIGKIYNPFFNIRNEDEMANAGLKLIKHRALLASYSYTYGENNVHVVI